MAWSLEARVPFMDTVVANFAFSLPAKHKVRGLQKKRLLRQGGRAAASARGRPRPQARLLDPRGGVAARGARAVRARDARARRRSAARASSTPTAVTRVLDEHVAGRRDNSRQLWGLLSFTLWHERHVEGVAPRRLARAGARVKVWVDFTASAHPLVFRPLVGLLEAAGPRRRDHGARLRADAAADRVARDDRDRDRPPRRPLGARQGAADALAPEGAARVGEAARVRSRARARLARADDDRSPPRHPERDDVRLRVGVAAAPARLPCGDPGRRAGLDPAPSASRATRPSRRSCGSTRGSRRSTTSRDFEPDPAVLEQWSIDPARVLVVLRPPPDVSLYHRHSNPLFPMTLEHLGRSDDVHAIVIPRTDEQRALRAVARPAVGDRP